MNVDFLPHAAEPNTASLQVPTSPPHRILVVEDDGYIRKLNTEALVQSGYHVDAAEHGAAAWETLQVKNYHLMVTDNDMPLLNGVELLKKVRAARMELPVIMATGALPTDEFARNPWLAPAAVLIKPYTIDELLRAVREVLRVDNGAQAHTATVPARQDQPTAGTSSPRGKADRAPIPGSAQPPRRILVVEDDSDIRQLNTEVLVHCGYQVDAAKDGAAAWKTLQTTGYDLLITDNEMPLVTGGDLLMKLHAAHLAVPVIMASETLPMDEFKRYPWLVPTATLIKPYTIDDLLRKVRDVLSGTDEARNQAAPAPAGQKQQPTDGWRP